MLPFLWPCVTTAACCPASMDSLIIPMSDVIPTRFPLGSILDVEHPQTFTNHTLPLIIRLQSTELSQSNEKKHMVPSRSFPANHVHLQPKSFRVSIESHLQFQGQVLQRSLAFKNLSQFHLFVATCLVNMHSKSITYKGKGSRVWKKAVTNHFPVYSLYVENT